MRVMVPIVACLLAAMLAAAGGNDIAGSYAGDWTSSSSGVSGRFHLTLASSADGKWQCEVTFSLDGEDVKTTVKSLKVEGAKLEVAYEFNIQGYDLRSTINGELRDKKLEGKYRTQAVADGSPVDEGEWKAKPAE